MQCIQGVGTLVSGCKPDLLDLFQSTLIMKAKANSQQLFGPIYFTACQPPYNAVSLPLHCKKISINLCVLWQTFEVQTVENLMVECLHPMFEKASGQWLLQLTQAESGSTIASSEAIAGG